MVTGLFKKGERVFVGEREALILDIMPPDIWAQANGWGIEYKIQYLNPDTATPVIVLERCLSSSPQSKIWGTIPIDAKSCECGVAAVRGTRHSDYCPLYTKEQQ